MLDPGSALRAVRDDKVSVREALRTVLDGGGRGPRAVWNDGVDWVRAVREDVGEKLRAVWDGVGEAAPFVIPAQAGIQRPLREGLLDPGS
ncbi:hypothetical protein, partial [Metallibacterium sp.]|uniref:hypothetical protein n=1 Tax=Metallibacterium sp. TaxID=2940281 RepID=UPI002621326F